ncbi:MAG: FHA domain-containing protein [Anaerolineae bacterium]|nr:FHA domain-containing protein [Anaerolineae bacterium]
MTQVSDKPVLIIRTGEAAGQRWVMHDEEVLVGRGAECDVVVPERQVSRMHVRVRRAGDRFFVEDLESKNGTLLNGEPLKGEAPLRDGDEIELARAVSIAFFGSEVTLPLEFVQSSTIVSSTGYRLSLDPASRRVFVDGRELDPPLSLPQYRLLELLEEKEGAVSTRDEVVMRVWPESAGEGVSEQAIDALVRRLRDRLTELEPDHQFVVTVRGHGFRLDNPPTD